MGGIDLSTDSIRYMSTLYDLEPHLPVPSSLVPEHPDQSGSQEVAGDYGDTIGFHLIQDFSTSFSC